MRFSLLYLLVIVWIAAGFIALDVTLYGGFEARQGIYVVFIVLMGALLGQYVYRRRWAAPDVPKVWPSLAGIVCVCFLVAGLDFIFGSHRNEVCTRSQQVRVLRNFGLVRFSTQHETKNSAVIRDVLKYAPGESHWVTTTEVGWSSIGSSIQSHWHLLLDWKTDELAALRVFSAAQIKDLMELDTGLDRRFAQFRMRNVFRPWREGVETAPKTDWAQAWYAEYGMFLRPLRSREDVRDALVAYRNSATWQRHVEHEFIEEMERSGIGVPANVPEPVVKR